MKKKTSKALLSFIKEHFDFSALKKAGVFPKDMKFNDYEGQAKVICHVFGLSNIYEYGKHEIRCHISYVGDRPLHINKAGELKPEPFVTVIHNNQMHI